MNKVILPLGLAVIGMAVADFFRKPGTSGAGEALIGGGTGLALGIAITKAVNGDKPTDTNSEST